MVHRCGTGTFDHRTDAIACHTFRATRIGKGGRKGGRRSSRGYGICQRPYRLVALALCRCERGRVRSFGSCSQLSRSRGSNGELGIAYGLAGRSKRRSTQACHRRHRYARTQGSAASHCLRTFSLRVRNRSSGAKGNGY